MLTWFVLLTLMVVALGGGGWGYPRWGLWSWSPAAALALVVGVLLFTGDLSVS